MHVTTASLLDHHRTVAGWPSFIILSLMIHLLLFWLLASPSTNIATASNLTVRLGVETATSLSADKSPQAVRQSSAPPAASPQQQTVDSEITVAAESASAATATPTVTTFDLARLSGNSASFGHDEKIAVDTDLNDNATPMVRAQLATRFAEHFHYPLLAQQRNWQGVVILSFRVERDGSLQDIEIAESSGFGVLDRAAVESLNAIGQLKFAPGTLLRDALQLRLPVVYHLAQG